MQQRVERNSRNEIIGGGERTVHLVVFPLLHLFQAQLLSKDFGKHLLEVDDLLQKHSLQEADITVQAERVETLNAAALKFTTIEGIVTHLTDLIGITLSIILKNI